jgi:hypothetical protein
MPPMTKNIKELEVGAGNFSFAPSRVAKLLKNGREVPEITCTTLDSEDVVKKDKLAKIGLDRIKWANAKPGVVIKTIFAIDATQLHTYPFLETRYHAIRFNMPHNRAEFKTGLMQQLMHDFFASAAKLQQAGDKIYVSVPQARITESKKLYYYQAYYNLYDASHSAGYNLFYKRKFKDDQSGAVVQRYPGYVHMQTGAYDKSTQSADNAREYVFVKTLLAQQELQENSKPYVGIFYDNAYNCYPVPDTDSDSDQSDFDDLSSIGSTDLMLASQESHDQENDFVQETSETISCTRKRIKI